MEIHKRKMIGSRQNMGQLRYGYFIKDSRQNNLDGSIHTIEKLIEAAEKVEFEDERHIELRM